MSTALRKIDTVNGLMTYIDNAKGARSIRNGDVEIWIDPFKLAAALGYKALRSKRGMAQLKNGAIVVRAINVRTKS